MKKWPRLTKTQLAVLRHGAFSVEIKIGFRRFEKWVLDFPFEHLPRIDVSSSVKSLAYRGLLRRYHTRDRDEARRGVLRRTFTVISPRMRGDREFLRGVTENFSEG
jgi:hypothetical protein